MHCIDYHSIHNASLASINFSKEDMFPSDLKHTRPLYFTSYIKDIPIPRVQIDPESALSLINITSLQELGITPNNLSKTPIRQSKAMTGKLSFPLAKSWLNFKLEAWIWKQHCMWLKPEPIITSCWEKGGCMTMLSFLPLSINASSIWVMTTTYTEYLQTRNLSRVKKPMSRMQQCTWKGKPIVWAKAKTRLLLKTKAKLRR